MKLPRMSGFLAGVERTIDQGCCNSSIEKFADVIVRTGTPQLEGITGANTDRVGNARLLEAD
jgi:hypothetical protein